VLPADVLHQGVPGDHDPGAVPLEPAHRSQPRLEAAVVSLDTVVGILLGAMPGHRQQFVQHRRVAAARSVTTRPGSSLLCRWSGWKNRRAAVASPREDTTTSMTWPNWSIAR
jgi:hypothetical protein